MLFPKINISHNPFTVTLASNNVIPELIFPSLITVSCPINFPHVPSYKRVRTSSFAINCFVIKISLAIWFLAPLKPMIRIGITSPLTAITLFNLASLSSYFGHQISLQLRSTLPNTEEEEC